MRARSPSAVCLLLAIGWQQCPFGQARVSSMKVPCKVVMQSCRMELEVYIQTDAVRIELSSFPAVPAIENFKRIDALVTLLRPFAVYKDLLPPEVPTCE